MKINNNIDKLTSSANVSNSAQKGYYIKSQPLAYDSVSFTGKKMSKGAFARAMSGLMAAILLLTGCSPKSEAQETIGTPTTTTFNDIAPTTNPATSLKSDITSQQFAQTAQNDYTGFITPQGSEVAANVYSYTQTQNNTIAAFDNGSENLYNKKNNGSLTVLYTNDNSNVVNMLQANSFAIPQDVSNYTVANLITLAYGDLSDGEIANAAYLLADNNENVLEQVNFTYLMAQMADKYKQDMQIEGKLPQFVVSAIQDIATQGGLDYTNTQYSFLNADEFTNLTSQEIAQVKAAKAKLESFKLADFQSIDETSDVEDIPYAVILGTDLSNLKGQNIIALEIDTLSDAGKNGVEFQQSVGFPAKSKTLAIQGNSQLSKEDAIKMVQNAIGAQYSGVGAVNLLKDNGGSYILDSYAGANILRAIALDANNNAIFDGHAFGSNDDILNILAQEVMTGNDFEIATPNTSVSFIYKNEKDFKDATPAQNAVQQRDDINITQLHVTRSAVNYDDLKAIAALENRDVQAKDLLNFVEYQNTTLANAIASSTKGSQKYNELIALGASAIQQLAETNPEILNGIISNSAMTPQEILDAVISIPYAMEKSQNFDETLGFNIDLQDINYITTVTPKVRVATVPEDNTPQNPTQAPSEAPSNPPTEPPVDPTNPTNPPVDPTDPTDPPTEPPVDPTDPTECPENPSVPDREPPTNPTEDGGGIQPPGDDHPGTDTEDNEIGFDEECDDTPAVPDRDNENPADTNISNGAPPAQTTEDNNITMDEDTENKEDVVPEQQPEQTPSVDTENNFIPIADEEDSAPAAQPEAPAQEEQTPAQNTENNTVQIADNTAQNTADTTPKETSQPAPKTDTENNEISFDDISDAAFDALDS